MKTGVISAGIELPIVREGDNLKEIILESIDPTWIDDNDIIGITESVVARSQGNYVTIDEIAEEIKRVMGNLDEIIVVNCIYSRNRFAMILKAVARAANKKVKVYMPRYDEVGNIVTHHPFTKIDYWKYYEEVIKAEGKEALIMPAHYNFLESSYKVLYCGLHDYNNIKRAFPTITTLADIFKDKCEYGLLGCNKSTEERVKLFPNTEKAQDLCYELQKSLKDITGKHVIVTVYGDGCFKDPVGGIWEFADPVTMPAYTDKDLIESSPNEIKLKAVIDEGKTDEEVYQTIKNKSLNLKGDMLSQGTTPRKYRDLLASLMDLTSGSGDRGTPVIIVKNYFKNGRN